MIKKTATVLAAAIAAIGIGAGTANATPGFTGSLDVSSAVQHDGDTVTYTYTVDNPKKNSECYLVVQYGYSNPYQRVDADCAGGSVDVVVDTDATGGGYAVLVVQNGANKVPVDRVDFQVES